MVGVNVMKGGFVMFFGGFVDLNLGFWGGSVRVVDVKWIVIFGGGVYIVIVFFGLRVGGLGLWLKIFIEFNFFFGKKYRFKFRL